jgi:cytochrome c oxidase subunit 1
VFSVLASSLGLPAVILLLSWFGTLWNARVRLNTSLLFALGFVSLFVSGGLSGLFLARNDFTSTAVTEDFVAGHFHLVMGVAATFAILAALFFWFPKLFGRRMNEPLGELHFWLTFAGVYCVFMPMHWLGLVSHAAKNPGAHLASIAEWIGLARSFVTAGILITVFAQGIFLFNFLWSLFRGERVEDSNPWRATTLEWRAASAPQPDDLGAGERIVYRGAYEFNVPGIAEDFIPQHIAPDQVVQAN